MLNWQGWAATNFVGWGSVGTTTPPVTTPYPGPAGRAAKRRRKVEIDGQVFSLTDDEIQGALDVVLRRDEDAPVPKALKRPVKALRRAVAAAEPDLAPVAPTYAAAPDFDALWRGFVQADQHEMAAASRAAAMALEIEQDDADVFALLRMIEEADDD